MASESATIGEIACLVGDRGRHRAHRSDPLSMGKPEDPVMSPQFPSGL